jgi:hypothetical protein
MRAKDTISIVERPPSPFPAGLKPLLDALRPIFGSMHKGTPIRWAMKGIRVNGGDRVKLRAWRLGSRWMTDAESVEEFARAVLVPAGRPAQATRAVCGDGHGQHAGGDAKSAD